MKVAIGNDHTAVEMKNHILKYLEAKGYTMVNYGTDTSESADYPLYGKKVAEAVASGECLSAERASESPSPQTRSRAFAPRFALRPIPPSLQDVTTTQILSHLAQELSELPPQRQ